MIYAFPKTKFTEENSGCEQLEHIFSEVLEITNDYAVEEAMDLYHSLETFFHILATNGVNVDAVQQRVFEKNRNRGYYKTGE